MKEIFFVNWWVSDQYSSFKKVSAWHHVQPQQGMQIAWNQAVRNTQQSSDNAANFVCRVTSLHATRDNPHSVNLGSVPFSFQPFSIANKEKHCLKIKSAKLGGVPLFSVFSANRQLPQPGGGANALCKKIYVTVLSISANELVGCYAIFFFTVEEA